MATVLLWIGRLAGMAGVLVCVLAVVLRLRNVYNFAGFQIGTLLLGGIATMLVGCLAYLVLTVEWPRK